MNELCDGKPSQETIQFLRSLDRPLDAPLEDITRLYGTNFDTCVVNQDMLEQMDGEMVSYKAKDNGTKQSLKHNKLLCKGNLVCSNKELNDLFNGTYIQYIILNKQKSLVFRSSWKQQYLIIWIWSILGKYRFIFDQSNAPCSVEGWAIM